jgi:hypothetical protein
MKTKLPFQFKLLAASMCIAASAGAFAGNSQTAQGIMVNLAGSGDFALGDTMMYRFNPANASAYFSNAWDGNAPTVNCTGGSACSTATAPAAPAAPAPDAGYVDSSNGRSRAQGADQANECTFFVGGNLNGKSYTQTASVTQSVPVLVGKQTKYQSLNYTYTYTYNVTPTVASVPSLTAWDLYKSTGDTIADISINADIAGESVVVSNQFPSGKYSFSLTDSVVGNRVQGLALTVSDTTGWSDTQYPNSTVFANYPNGSLDFDYTTNAGINGTAQSFLKNGDALTILNSDTFAGNNNGGADGSALAKAVVDTVNLSLPVGDYNVRLTGTVKGNSAVADLPFSVTQTVHIIGQGCGSL